MSRSPYRGPLNVGRQKMFTHPGVSAFEARIAHYSVAPEAVTDILGNIALTDEEQVLTEFISQPDIARVLNIVADAAAAGIAVTLKGRDIAGNEVSETIHPLAEGANATTYAYAKVTEVILPAQEPALGTVSITTSYVIGLPATLRHNTVLGALFNNSSIIGAAGFAVETNDNIAINQLHPGIAAGAAFDGEAPLDIYFLVPTV